MTKKQTYIALSTALVVVLGVIGYLGMGANEPDLEAGPPVLEENPSLSGTLTAEGDRYFRVDDDGEADLLNYGSKSPSNFLIFTTPSNFPNTTLDSLSKNLIVDDGLSGYVLGSYMPDNGGWNLYPSGNYLGAQTLSAADTVGSCQTYFLIKIADDHNTENGFGAGNGWGAEQRSQIAYDASYFDTINTGTTSCTTEDKSLTPNAWNMVTTNVASADGLLGEFDLFEKVYAVWDTTVINQIDRSVNPSQTRNANVKVYVDSENTGLENNLLDYFNGGVKSASIFDADASYDGGKQDLWVYVGELGEVVVPVNNPPELIPEDRVVDISDEINQAKKQSVKEASLSPLGVFLTTELKVPDQEVFSTVDSEGDTLSLLNQDSNGFNYNFDGSSINIKDTAKSYFDLMLDANGQRDYQVEARVSDGNSSATGGSTITYEWTNSCVAIANQYEDHLLKSLEHRIYEEYKSNGEDFESALRFVLQEVEDTIANSNFGSTDPNLTEEQIREEVRKYWESLSEKVAGIRFSSEYLENPPYLPAQCGGGFGTCVDVAACTYLVDSVSNYMYGFGILVEKIAFPRQSESQTIEQSVMASESRETERSSTTSSSQVAYSSNVETLEGACSEKRLESSDVVWWNGTAPVSSELTAAQTEGYKLYTIVDLSPCDELWEISYIDGNGNNVIGSMEVGQQYQLNSANVYIRDTLDKEKITSNYANVYAVLGSDNKLGVYMSIVPMRESYNDPVSGFDDPEFFISDGIFWYQGNDLDGVTSKKF